jgi:ferredoxin-NADP reductase
MRDTTRIPDPTFPAWPIFSTRLRNRYEIAAQTLAFDFERPPGWTFKAGQFIDITLLDPPETDAEGNVRGFSIASAPYEDTITIATRMRDTAFKRVLKAAPLDTKVKIEGPFGNLMLPESAARPAVLLARGIGITPFRSMVMQAAKDRLPHRIFLFYSNPRPEDALFLEELGSLEQQNPNYTLIATMTEMPRSNRSWPYEKGFISKEMLRKYMEDPASPVYYVAGPPQVVQGLRSMLRDTGVRDDDVRIEEFAGY